MFKRMTPALCLAGLMALAACSSDDKDDASRAGKNLTREPGLQGYWASSCDKLELLSSSGKAFYAFAPATYSKKVAVYSDTNCATQTSQIVYSGDFKIGNDDDLEGVDRVDFVPTKATVKALTEAGVNALNAVNLCGIKDWALNAERDVSVAAKNGCLTEKVGVAQYDVYHLEDKKLQFGSAYVLGAPTDVKNRSAELNQRVFQPTEKWE